MVQLHSLQQKAKAAGIANLRTAPHSAQLAIYQSTLKDLEEYLDTGDLRKLGLETLENIQKDIREMIDRLREITKAEKQDKIRSIDGVLERLRSARDHVQVARSMFTSSILEEKNASRFFSELRSCRESIAEAIRLLVQP